MKPIALKIAGLHSFREEQEIPFDKLSELGVFVFLARPAAANLPFSMP